MEPWATGLHKRDRQSTCDHPDQRHRLHSTILVSSIEPHYPEVFQVDTFQVIRSLIQVVPLIPLPVVFLGPSYLEGVSKSALR